MIDGKNLGLSSEFLVHAAQFLGAEVVERVLDNTIRALDSENSHFLPDADSFDNI